MSQASEIVKALVGVVDQALFDGINMTGATQLVGIRGAAITFIEQEETEVPVQEEFDLDE